jgi:alanine dehydrogenase
MKVAVVKENTPGEQRVALVPETVPKLMAAGAEVLVENGAGEAAWFPDSAYAEAGAAIVTATELYAKAEVILMVTRPGPEAVSQLRAGRAVFGTGAGPGHPGGHRGQPGRAAPYPVPSAADGRAQLPGQRRGV